MEEKFLGFNQKFLIENRLDARDRELLIHMRIIEKRPKTIKKSVGEEKYFWLNYKLFLEKYPAFDIETPDGLGKRIEKYVELGILKRIVKRECENGTRGTFIFLSFSKKFIENYREEQPVHEPCHNNNLNNLDNNKNNNNIIFKGTEDRMLDKRITELEKENKSLMQKFFEEMPLIEQQAIDMEATALAREEYPNMMDSILHRMVRVKHRYLVLRKKI